MSAAGSTPLSPSQRRALAHVTALARDRSPRARQRLAAVANVDELIAAVRDHGRVTLNFHPDRLLADGRSVAERLAVDGIYRGQFETGISNGSRTAFAGGERDRWEERLFGGAYHGAGGTEVDRPKYGALNLLDHPDGGAPRFGSCHVRLQPAVNARCTFTVGDSHLGPADVGTIDAFDSVLAGLVETSVRTGITLGAPGRYAVDVLRGLPGRQIGARPDAPPGRSLDDYLEAQVHGPVDLAGDAEALVLDPSFRGSTVAATLADLAERCGIALEWHAGFELFPKEVGPDFRGPQIPRLAAFACAAWGGERGVVDASVVGRAAASVVRTPQSWLDWGSQGEVLQLVKYLWHTLVQYGHPGPVARGVDERSRAASRSS